jgi:carbamate kinase
VRSLVEAGILVVASGGGGIPVAERADGTYEGREAVIDKDLAAVVLARAVGADGLLLLTDVDAVYRGWGAAEPEPIRRLSVDEALEGLAGNAWPAGSMGPKVRACAEFVRGGGSFAAIGRLEDAAALAWGRAGTRFGSGRLGLPPFSVPGGVREG